MNSRKKGLARVREVRKILEGIGHQVEGPDYSLAYFQGRMQAIHRDYFGVGDLISFFEGQYMLHQVTDLPNKSRHINSILEKKLPCWVWCFVSEKRKTWYRVFMVDTKGEISEGSIQWKISGAEAPEKSI